MSAELSPTENDQNADVDEQAEQFQVENAPSLSRNGESFLPPSLLDGRFRYALISATVFSKKVIMSDHVQFFAGVTTGIFFLLLVYQLLVFAIGFFALMYA